MGRIKKIEKQTDNPFLNLYHLIFEDKRGGKGDYYFCTRNKYENLKIRTHELAPEGICIYAVTKEEIPRLVVIREYRLPVDEEIYTLPAGLIDPGESPVKAAVREMKEECGFHFTEYEGGPKFYRRPFFLAPGFSDEPGSIVYGTVDDLKGKSKNEKTEWIAPMLCTKSEVRRILEEEKMSARAALLCFLFLNTPDDNPFAFMEA